MALIVLGIFGLWLEWQCKFGAFLQAIYDGPGFVQFVLALIVFLAILSVIGEPYSTWLAAIVILGMFMLDHQRNGNNDIWGQFGLTK